MSETVQYQQAHAPLRECRFVRVEVDGYHFAYSENLPGAVGAGETPEQAKQAMLSRFGEAMARYDAMGVEPPFVKSKAVG